MPHRYLADFSGWLWPAMAVHLWQATLFALPAAAFAAILRRSSASARFAVWGLAAFKFALPGSLAAALAALLVPARIHVPAAVSNPVLLAGPMPLRTTPSVGHNELLCIMTLVWVAVALLLLARWAWQARRSSPLPSRQSSARELDALERARKRVNCRVPIRLRASAEAREPGLRGFVRPLLVLPPGIAESLGESELESVLMHEAVHARRRDNLTAALAHALACFFWFHPLVWWLEARMLAERERACDEAVLRHGAPREHYAAGILKVCRLYFAGAAPAVAGVTGSPLRERMEQIMFQPLGKWSGAHAAAIAALAAIFLVLPAVIASRGLAAAQSQARVYRLTAVRIVRGSTTANQPVPVRPEPGPRATPYEKWLNEDVLYIAAAEERAAFEHLGNDEERERFIEQFWQRRDPNPSTPKNEFKEEHYRRIAYANKRFTEGGVPGWLTDRGWIYIRFGPPDEMESHPGAYDEWAYRTGQERLHIRFDLPSN